MLDLDDRHILIIGGSRGIGAATARLAARAGARVTLTWLSRSAAAEAVCAEIAAGGGRARHDGGDVSEPGVAERIVSAAVTEFGELDGLVVAAGVFEPGPIEEMDAAFWDRTMAVNVRGSFLAVQAALPSLRRSGGGSIVLYSSTAGQRGSEVYSAYATSKGAQLLFMRSMARELAADGIRCNAVAPGWTDTDMASSALSEADKRTVSGQIPLGRLGRPEDPAAAAVFLLSDLAAYITGSTITVDGGFDMRG